MRNGVRSDNQKSNKTALPKGDFFSVFLRCAASYPVHEDSGEANKFQNKITEEFPRMLESPRKTK